ncbi:TlpA family protein disulfide reductase [Singulisphaera sp. PoT]|uniref:TlpA family protein disulfide reductase n=1 Tax=Singulisphaera sp. PoT TaxID=3411797 RepID=UPI003BF5399A
MPPSSRLRHGSAIIVALTIQLSSAAFLRPTRADEAASAVPRYQLQVGQELKYKGSSELKYADGAHGFKTDWQAWVVRKNADGSWRVVMRSSQSFWMKREGKEQGDGQVQATVAYCDLHPDGRASVNDSFNHRFEPSALFPRLPEDEAQAKEGWSARGYDDEDARTEFKPLGGTSDADLVFEGIPQSTMGLIYVSSQRSKYDFDRKRGLIKRIDSENSQGYGFNGKGTGVTELIAIEPHGADWAKRFGDEADLYFAANKTYQDLQAKASKSVGVIDEALDQAEKTLKEARAKLTFAPLQEQVDEQLKRHAALRSYYKQEARNRAEVIGKDAAEWDAVDLDGKAHSLKGYRGKVVILDFWNRGCGWCIRAMPQMKQLADDFKGEPVAVLGMNTDGDETDARFVAETMKLNYPTVKAQGVPEKYNVQGFPTLIVVDQEGKVADIHVGYSATLRDEVSRIIRGLLAKK